MLYIAIPLIYWEPTQVKPRKLNGEPIQHRRTNENRYGPIAAKQNHCGRQNKSQPIVWETGGAIEGSGPANSTFLSKLCFCLVNESWISQNADSCTPMGFPNESFHLFLFSHKNSWILFAPYSTCIRCRFFFVSSWLQLGFLIVCLAWPGLSCFCFVNRWFWFTNQWLCWANQ